MMTPNSTCPAQASILSDSYVQLPCSISEIMCPKLSSFYCPQTCSSFLIPCQLTTTCAATQAKTSGHPSLTSLYPTPPSDTKFYYPIILISFTFSPSSLPTPSTSPNRHHLLMLGCDHNLYVDSLYSLFPPSHLFTRVIFLNVNLIMSLPSCNSSVTSKCPENSVQVPQTDLHDLSPASLSTANFFHFVKCTMLSPQYLHAYWPLWWNTSLSSHSLLYHLINSYLSFRFQLPSHSLRSFV